MRFNTRLTRIFETTNEHKFYLIRYKFYFAFITDISRNVNNLDNIRHTQNIDKLCALKLLYFPYALSYEYIRKNEN